MASNKAVKLVINQEPFIKLTIKQAPKPPVRLLADHIDKYSQIYENKKARVFKKLVAHKYCLEYERQLPTEKLLAIDIRFYLPIAQSISANEQLKKRISRLCPDIRPDIANNLLYSRYDKAIIDALNGLAFKDNSQIIASQTQNIYSDNPHTKIELTEITEM